MVEDGGGDRQDPGGCYSGGGCVACTGRKLGNHKKPLSRDGMSCLTSFLFPIYFNLTDSVCYVENSEVAQGRVETRQEMRPPLRRSWLPGAGGSRMARMAAGPSSWGTWKGPSPDLPQPEAPFPHHRGPQG